MVTRSKQSERTESRSRFGWRGLLTAVLTVIGLTALTAYTIVHWTERQILTTENWVQVVAPLPQNNEVATALSTYAVDRLFTSLDLENRISEALPERAAFLAAPLAEQLDEWLTRGTKNVIQSDRFTNVWTSANRAASERLLNTARGETSEEPTGKQREARFNLDLSALRTTVSSLLEQRRERQGEAAEVTAPAPEPRADREVGVVVNLKQSAEKIHMYIRLVDFLNATLWLLAAACLLGAIVVSRARRRLLLLMSLVVVVVALLQLIGVNALRPAVLENVQQAAFRPAVGVVYDTLLDSFKRSATLLFGVGAPTFLFAYVLHSNLLRKSKSVAGLLDRAGNSKVGNGWQTFRLMVRRYRFQIIGAVLVLGLILMAFSFQLDWQGIIRAALILILAVEVVYLIAARPQAAPMEQ